MSDGSPVSPERDARMLAYLRAWRRSINPIQVTLTVDEFNMLLRVADERDALKAAACEMPDERPSNVTPIRREAKIHIEPVTDERPRCDVCSSVIVPDRLSTSGWRHAVRPIRLHPAKPIA